MLLLIILTIFAATSRGYKQKRQYFRKKTDNRHDISLVNQSKMGSEGVNFFDPYKHRIFVKADEELTLDNFKVVNKKLKIVAKTIPYSIYKQDDSHYYFYCRYFDKKEKYYLFLSESEDSGIYQIYKISICKNNWRVRDLTIFVDEFLGEIK